MWDSVIYSSSNKTNQRKYPGVVVNSLVLTPGISEFISQNSQAIWTWEHFLTSFLMSSSENKGNTSLFN